MSASLSTVLHSPCQCGQRGHRGLPQRRRWQGLRRRRRRGVLARGVLARGPVPFPPRVRWRGRHSHGGRDDGVEVVQEIKKKERELVAKMPAPPGRRKCHGPAPGPFAAHSPSPCVLAADVLRSEDNANALAFLPFYLTRGLSVTLHVTLPSTLARGPQTNTSDNSNSGSSTCVPNDPATTTATTATTATATTTGYDDDDYYYYYYYYYYRHRAG